ncbi:hypothetical protein LJC74_05290 [Eubacteriales bacterium OttesenSCG-928-A19]|nr:hypothetical protein [Eubacteriales bacterium OttesenSCG-928-A19]
MTGEVRGLRATLVAPREKRLHGRLGLALILFAALHFYFQSLLALSGWLPSLALGEAIILAVYLLGKNKKSRGIALGMTAAFALAMICLLPEGRDGAKRLLNQLFSNSEARNRYVYARFAVLADAAHSEALLRMGLAVMGAIVSVVIVNAKGGAGTLCLTALIVGGEIYFGIVPDTGFHLLLFLCLAAILICKSGTAPSSKHYAWLLSLALAIGLLVGLLLPGVDPELEHRSEQLRDWFSQTLESSAAGGLDAEESLNLIRKESLLAEENANGLADESQDARGYERSLVYRQDISNPWPVDYFRIALLLLLIVALLLVPFLPFLWLDRQKRNAAAMRVDFDAPDCSQAILAMFRHVVRCLTVFGLSDGNKGFMRLMPTDDPRFSDAYREEYQYAALLWQEAAYSAHPMTMEQKETVFSLLRETERLVYGLSDRKMRFRLKYMECLILPEDAA